MSADNNLNLGGNADLIRPKYNNYTWDFFYAWRLLRISQQNFTHGKDDEK